MVPSMGMSMYHMVCSIAEQSPVSPASGKCPGVDHSTRTVWYSTRTVQYPYQHSTSTSTSTVPCSVVPCQPPLRCCHAPVATLDPLRRKSSTLPDSHDSHDSLPVQQSFPYNDIGPLNAACVILRHVAPSLPSPALSPSSTWLP